MNKNNKDWDNLNRLVKRHRALDNEADKLNSIRHLSQMEKNKLKKLKVMRLRCRDEIARLRNELSEAAELV